MDTAPFFGDRVSGGAACGRTNPTNIGGSCDWRPKIRQCVNDLWQLSCFTSPHKACVYAGDILLQFQEASMTHESFAVTCQAESRLLKPENVSEHPPFQWHIWNLDPSFSRGAVARVNFCSCRVHVENNLKQPAKGSKIPCNIPIARPAPANVGSTCYFRPGRKRALVSSEGGIAVAPCRHRRLKKQTLIFARPSRNSKQRKLQK